MRSYRQLSQAFASSARVAGATPSEERVERAQRLSQITFEDLLRDRLAYGSPESVVRQLTEIQEELQLSGFIAEMNVGGLIPRERVLNSVRLFAQEVAPALR